MFAKVSVKFKYVLTHKPLNNSWRYKMTNMTLSIPKELHSEMTAHSEIRWSDVARQAFEKKVEELH